MFGDRRQVHLWIYQVHDEIAYCFNAQPLLQSLSSEAAACSRCLPPELHLAVFIPLVP